jgi:hypothetical protein
MKGGTPYSSAPSSAGSSYSSSAPSGGSYSSASSYGTYVNGTGGQQYARVFDQSGPYANIKGNGMIGAQGQRAGGRRGKKSKTRKRGGNVLSAAAVPFSLLAMQQSYKPGFITSLAKNPFASSSSSNRPPFANRPRFSRRPRFSKRNSRFRRP